MTATRVAVPVSVYSVTYEVRSGRPYSGFERLVLEAVVQGHSRLLDLEQIFAVHRRVLVEAVVTLVHAGWVALTGSDGELVPTPSGIAAAAGTNAPTTVLIRRPPLARVLMEQVNGQLTAAPTASYRTLTDADRTDLIVLDRRVHRATLDPGEVQYLLPHGPGEWVSWIDPDVSLMSSGFHYVVAEVDVGRGVVHNLPAPFVDSLEAVLADRLGTPVMLRRDSSADTNTVTTLSQRTSWYAPVSDDSLLSGVDEHVDLLEHVLEHAVSRVVIASAFISERALQRLAPKLTGALLRGVDVDLLWGYEGDQPFASSRAVLDGVSSTARGLRASGRLVVNEHATGSHLKVLVWDDVDGWHSAIGSFNWLSATRDAALMDMTMNIVCPGLCAAVFRHLADVWRGGEVLRAADSCPREWLGLAAALEAEQATQEAVSGARRVSLTFGRSHEIALRNALRHAQHRLVITSHRIGPVGLSRLGAGDERDRPDAFRGVVVVDELIDGTTEADAKGAASQARCGLLRRPVHAKVLVHDDTVTIGSYNYLSADIAGTGSRSKELSIRIEDSELPVRVVERLQGLQRPA